MDTEKNIIDIIEDGNRLDFKSTYSPIVCGNSGYCLRFEFGENWAKCLHKTAILILDDKRFAVDFEDDIVELPPLPNCRWLYVALTSSVNEKIVMSTTTIKIRLEPSLIAEDLSEFDPVSGYLPKMIGLINKFEQGDIAIESSNHANTATNATTAEHAKTATYSETSGNASNAETAEHALVADNATHASTADNASNCVNAVYATTAGTSQTQVSLTGDETISGVKNFVGDIQINGTSLAEVIENAGSGSSGGEVIRDNILFNGNFLINQRRATVYNCKIKLPLTLDVENPVIYTVDRWRGSHGLVVTPLTNGVKVFNTGNNTDEYDNYYGNFFEQPFEYGLNIYGGQNLTLSCKVNDTIYSGSALIPETAVAGDEFITIDLGKNGGENNDKVFFGMREDGNLTVRFVVDTNSTLIINYCKLEFGNSVTAYRAPDPLKELKRCQRFYFKSEDGYIQLIARTTVFPYNISFQFPTEMRDKPTIVKFFAHGFGIYTIDDPPKTSFLFDCTTQTSFNLVYPYYVYKSGFSIYSIPNERNQGELVNMHTYCGGVIADAEFYNEDEISCLKELEHVIKNVEIY